jgi:hypothetical protein
MDRVPAPAETHRLTCSLDLTLSSGKPAMVDTNEPQAAATVLRWRNKNSFSSTGVGEAPQSRCPSRELVDMSQALLELLAAGAKGDGVAG